MLTVYAYSYTRPHDAVYSTDRANVETYVRWFHDVEQFSCTIEELLEDISMWELNVSKLEDAWVLYADSYEGGDYLVGLYSSQNDAQRAMLALTGENQWGEDVTEDDFSVYHPGEMGDKILL